MKSLSRRGCCAGVLLLGFPVLLHAFEQNSSDVQEALRRHDVRRLKSLAASGAKALRLEALESLVRLNDPQAVPFLVQQLNDSDPDILQAALWGLPNYGAHAGSPEIIARVEQLEGYGSKDVRRTAKTVLEDIRNPDHLEQQRNGLTSKDSDRRKEALAYFTQRKDFSILMRARDMLQDADPHVKQTGILLIHGLDDRDHLDAVAKLLSDPAPAVRATAVLVVGDWKEASAFELLQPLLKDPVPLVRASVVSVLGKHQDPGISAALAGMKSDPAPTVRITLAKALAQFASPASTEGLLALSLDDNPLVRGPAIESLVAFHDVALTEKMKRHLTDKTSRRRRRAAIAYLSNPSLLTSPAVFLPLLHDRDDEVRLDAVQALFQTSGGHKAQLVYLLNDPLKDIRLLILRKLDILLKLPNVNKRALKLNVGRLVKDPDPEVQALAKKYLVLLN